MKSIHHLLDIATPAATVWTALTETDGLTGWWGGTLRATGATLGGRLDWTFSNDFNPVMEIVTLDEPRELVWRCVAGHDPRQDSTFRFLLETLEGGRTRLRFSLNLYCVTGAGKPFQPSA